MPKAWVAADVSRLPCSDHFTCAWPSACDSIGVGRAFLPASFLNSGQSLHATHLRLDVRGDWADLRQEARRMSHGKCGETRQVRTRGNAKLPRFQREVGGAVVAAPHGAVPDKGLAKITGGVQANHLIGLQGRAPRLVSTDQFRAHFAACVHRCVLSPCLVVEKDHAF